ncbi:hypothetical protein M3Y96_01254600 [Aphelenchoides besseyi]|nr:hypothetical protein M3Y96_01254600 [Aphelenchoides besseyi]
MLFLLFKPTAIATSGKECLEDDGSSLNYNGKCNKFNVDLETDDESLSIKMDYAKDIVATLAPFTMTVGGCDITGKISNKNGDGSFIRESTNARLPTTFQVSKDKITYGAGIAISCSVKFESMGEKGGFKVAVKYNPDKDLPGLRLTFDNAKFIGDREEESDWSWSGWRIYVCIAGVLAGVLIVGSIIFYLCYRRRQNIANRDAALQAGTSTTDLTTATSKLSTTNASQVSSNTTMAAPLPALKTQSTVGQQAVPQPANVGQQAAPQPANVGQEAAPEQRAAPPLPVQAQESKSTERDHTGELIVQNMERQAREKEAEEKKEKEEREKQEKEKQEKEKQTPRAKKTSSNDKLSRGSNTSKGSKSSKGSKKHKKKDGKLKAAEEGGAVAKKTTENQPGTSKEGDGTKNQDEASVLKLDKTKSEHSVMGDLEADPAQNVAKQDVREEPRQEPREEAREAAPPPKENPRSWDREWPKTAPTEAYKQYLDSLLLGSLMFLRRRCEGWSLCFMLFLLFKPTAIATSGKECLEDDGSSLNYNGKCNKFNVDLETDDESLSIKMDYAKDIVATLAPFTMTVGGCDITGKISNKNGDGSFIRESTNARLPTTFQVSKDKITYGAGIAISCSVKFESMGEKGGFKVAVKYNPDKDLPGLRLTFEEREKQEKEKQEKEKQTPRAKKTSSNDKLSRGSNTSKGSKSSKGSKKHKKKDGKLKAAEEGGAVAKKTTENQPGTSKEGDGTKNQDEASVLKLDKTKSEHSVMGDLEADPAQNVAKQDVREEPRQEPREEAREAAPPPKENPRSWDREWPKTAPTEAYKQYVREHYLNNYEELVEYSNRHPITQETLNALGPWYDEIRKADADYDAKIFTPTEKADYSYFIYIFIAIVVVALVVKLLAIVCWYCRKRRARARNQEPNASKPTINANLGTEAQAPNVA